MPNLSSTWIPESASRFLRWLFLSPPCSPNTWNVIKWWEFRRIPFNVIIGMYGGINLIVYLLAIQSAGHLEPGEDAIEPIALLAAPIGINALYTLGWILESTTRAAVPELSLRFGPRLLKIGLAASVLLVTLPSAYWVSYCAIRLLGDMI